MMGDANPQRALFYDISLETFVPADRPRGRCMDDTMVATEKIGQIEMLGEDSAGVCSC